MRLKLCTPCDRSRTTERKWWKNRISSTRTSLARWSNEGWLAWYLEREKSRSDRSIFLVGCDHQVSREKCRMENRCMVGKYDDFRKNQKYRVSSESDGIGSLPDSHRYGFLKIIHYTSPLDMRFLADPSYSWYTFLLISCRDFCSSAQALHGCWRDQ